MAKIWNGWRFIRIRAVLFSFLLSIGATVSGAYGQSPTWTQLPVVGPPPPGRAAASTVYSAIDNKLLLFCGHTGFTNINDVWILSGANGLGGTPSWAQLGPAGSLPTGRAGHTAVYDSSSSRMIVFGGNDISGVSFNDVWVLLNANGQGVGPVWSQLTPTGVPPAPRTLHTAVYDLATNRMIVFGGIGGFTVLNDVWVLDHANGLGGTPTWVQLSPAGGPPHERR